MDNVVFGGHPVKIEVRGDDMLLTCKGVTGRLSELEAFLSKSNYPSNYYPFGDKCEIEGDRIIQIACLRESKTTVNRVVRMLREELSPTTYDELTNL